MYLHEHTFVLIKQNSFEGADSRSLDTKDTPGANANMRLANTIATCRNHGCSGGRPFPMSTTTQTSNILSMSTNPLRRLVSGNRRRIQDGRYDLDLSYITKNVIAMSMPSESLNSLIRNHFEDVAAFLNHHHGTNYKVFNLCEEYSYPGNKFPTGVETIPFKDHEPPSMQQIFDFCLRARQWMHAGENNVLVVHCKGGKGRTGTMICAWLLFSGQAKSAAEALSVFEQGRTSKEAFARGFREGCAVPSQRRMIFCFENLLKSRTALPDTLAALHSTHPESVGKKALTSVCLRPVSRLLKMAGTGGKVRLNVMDKASTLLGSQMICVSPAMMQSSRFLEIPALDAHGKTLMVEGDFKIEFVVSCSGVFWSQSLILFSAWLYAGSIKTNELCLPKNSLDLIWKDKGNLLLDENFTCTLHFMKEKSRSGPCDQIFRDINGMESNADSLMPLHINGHRDEHHDRSGFSSLNASAASETSLAEVQPSSHEFLVNVVTSKCKWFQSTLSVLPDNRVKMIPVSEAGQIMPGFARWFQKFSLSSASAYLSSTSSSGSDAVLDFGRCSDFNFDSSADSNDYWHSEENGKDTRPTEIVFHVAKIVRFYRDVKPRSTSKQGVNVHAASSGDKITIEFSNGKNINLISSSSFNIMAELRCVRLRVSSCMRARARMSCDTMLLLFLKIDSIIVCLSRAAHALDSARLPSILKVYDILSRAIPHAPQGRQVNTASALNSSLKKVFCSVFPHRDVPELEDDAWEPFGCVQKVGDPDLVLQPFAQDNVMGSRKIHAESVALELLAYFATHYTTAFREVVLQDGPVWQDYKVLEVSVVLTRMLLLQLGLRKLVKGTRLVEWTQQPTDLLVCLLSLEATCDTKTMSSHIKTASNVNEKLPLSPSDSFEMKPDSKDTCDWKSHVEASSVALCEIFSLSLDVSQRLWEADHKIEDLAPRTRENTLQRNALGTAFVLNQVVKSAGAYNILTSIEDMRLAAAKILCPSSLDTGYGTRCTGSQKALSLGDRGVFKIIDDRLDQERTAALESTGPDIESDSDDDEFTDISTLISAAGTQVFTRQNECKHGGHDAGEQAGVPLSDPADISTQSDQDLQMKGSSSSCRSHGEETSSVSSPNVSVSAWLTLDEEQHNGQQERTEKEQAGGGEDSCKKGKVNDDLSTTIGTVVGTMIGIAIGDDGQSDGDASIRSSLELQSSFGKRLQHHLKAQRQSDVQVSLLPEAKSDHPAPISLYSDDVAGVKKGQEADQNDTNQSHVNVDHCSERNTGQMNQLGNSGLIGEPSFDLCASTGRRRDRPAKGREAESLIRSFSKSMKTLRL